MKTYRVFKGSEGNCTAMKWQLSKWSIALVLVASPLISPLCRRQIRSILLQTLPPHPYHSPKCGLKYWSSRHALNSANHSTAILRASPRFQCFETLYVVFLYKISLHFSFSQSENSFDVPRLVWYVNASKKIAIMTVQLTDSRRIGSSGQVIRNPRLGSQNSRIADCQ